ncbi:hypothetical protein ACFXKC_28220 [Streptomyces sp. NPDC059340]|uniref:hypothetical protein n=1 Tax=Streptomyces sp. NPDC059340 TaxID=3346806 RepID=UPI00368137AB
MSLNGRAQTTAAAGVALLAMGLTMSVEGLFRSDVSRSLGGISLTVTALTLIGLTFIRSWIVDTRDERRDLAHAQQRAEAERRTYVSAKAALESETGRLNHEVNVERAHVASTLISERQRMRAEFEEERLQITTEAFRTGVEMERSGAFRRDEPAMPANLIQFPKQEPSRSEQHARSREHGVVGP